MGTGANQAMATASAYIYPVSPLPPTSEFWNRAMPESNPALTRDA